MTPEEFERAKFIVETHRNLHERRRDLAVRVLFATLTFYAACAAVALSGKLSATAWPINMFVTGMFVALAVAATSHIRATRDANQLTLTSFVHPAEDLILESLRLKPPNQNPMKDIPFWHMVLVWCGAVAASAIFWLQS
jgi:hypothetical protein